MFSHFGRQTDKQCDLFLGLGSLLCAFECGKNNSVHHLLHRVSNQENVLKPLLCSAKCSYSLTRGVNLILALEGTTT